jgi:hypothetical protein
MVHHSQYSVIICILFKHIHYTASSFRENKPKTLVFNDWKRAFWVRFRGNWDYKFGHGFLGWKERCMGVKKGFKIFGWSCLTLGYDYERSAYTVTRLDVIFRHTDRVPLTHFVHRAKKVFGMWAWIFCWVFCATGIFGGVTEKYLSTGSARTFVLQIMRQVCYHCATASFRKLRYGIHCVPSWDFPAVSVVTGSRIFRPNLEVTCRDFPAVSAVTGSRISGRICGYLPGFSGVTFSGKEM